MNPTSVKVSRIIYEPYYKYFDEEWEKEKK